MPLRQSLLSFAAAFAPPKQSPSMSNQQDRERHVQSSSSSDTSDTIEVEVNEHIVQLPTPSETATESSGDYLQHDVARSRSKRTSKRLSRTDSLLQSPKSDAAKNRNVSGETLVNEANVSQESLVKNGIDKLNLPWNMSDVFATGSKADLMTASNDGADHGKQSMDTMTPEDEEEERERAAKAAAKKAKMAENERLWEKRKKAADKHATRRSSRASLLTKASELVSGVTESVLGKRKDRTADLKGSLRPRSASDARAATYQSEEPDAKKRRVTDGPILTTSQSAPALSSRKIIRPPKDKKWLSAGLYAGQQRDFDARHHGGSKGNKKNRGSTIEDEKKENKVMPLPMFFGERLLKEGRDFKLPFDVFSPLPPGQPKPDEWRKSNKNVFVGDSAQEWRVTKQMEYSACLCLPETGCDSDCMNRYMYYECDSKNCNLTAEQCGNRAFDDLRKRAKKGGKYNIGVEVIKTASRGYGVRSNRTFEPNQIIVEYSGEVINQDECDRRMRKEYKNNECYYLMLFDQNMIIDATTKGSIARFVNHSCEPNCRMEKWTVGGQPRMALFAGDRGIMTGEELTYDYNFDPFSQKNVQECRCGESKCRGFLGPKPKKDERKSEEEEDKPKSPKKSLKRKVVEVIEEAVEKVTKKRKTDSQVLVKKSQAKTRVYSNASPARKTAAMTAKAKAAARAIRGGSSSPIKAAAPGLARHPSKLQRMVQSTKEATSKVKASAAAGIKKSRSNTRLVSSTSATEALIEKNVLRSKSGKQLQLKSKVGSLKENVVRTVRGRQSGQMRSVRVIEAED